MDTAGLRPGTTGLRPSDAGLRDGACEGIEREGVERARREAARAAVVVYLVDAGEGMRAEDEAAIKSLGDRAIVALNKIDQRAARGGMPTPPLRGHASSEAVHAHGRSAVGMPPGVSALTGEGIPALTAAILDRLGYRPPAPGDAVPFTAAQAEALQSARSALGAGNAEEACRCLESIALRL